VNEETCRQWTSVQPSALEAFGGQPSQFKPVEEDPVESAVRAELETIAAEARYILLLRNVPDPEIVYVEQFAVCRAAFERIAEALCTPPLP
jgi:hypothetical protein